MADDQKPKTMDINDLVRELSKSSTAPTTPTPTPSALRPPIPAVPPAPKPLEMPRPQFNVPPKQFIQPNQPLAGQARPIPTIPSPAPGAKEYQSSIRTMNEDISKLKQGQKPTGIEVPRKIEQIVPAPQPATPSVGQAKPSILGPQFKIPSVNLGEAQKTGPLAQPKDFSKPPMISKIEPKPQIYVPQERQGAGNRNMLFLGIGAVAVVAGFSYWFFILKAPAPEVVVGSPTPTPTETPIQNLSSIFSGLVEVNTNTVYGDHQSTDQKGEFISLKDAQNQNTLSLILNWLVPPQNVKDNLGKDSLVLLFIQSEFFDAKGQIKISDLERRLIMVIEAKDASLLTQATSEWETSIVDKTSSVWSIDKSKQKSTTFLDNIYRGTSIRYKNFPYADRTIDYSIVTASNGKAYFVITNSRESMFSVIDKLGGF